jgi:formylglycine-generating enzyme required for sulfatase activity
VQGSTPIERARAEHDYGPGGRGRVDGELARTSLRMPAFALDRSPVTNAEYAEFVAACGAFPPDAEALSFERWTQLRAQHGIERDYSQIQRYLWDGRDPPPDRTGHPAVLVNQDDAAFYCAWRGGRLPTAREWERAARGPTGNDYPWGAQHDALRANTAARGRGDTLEVGVLPAGNTPEGFTDMGGNVSEWTSSPSPGEPTAAVVKGSGWDMRPGFGRGAARMARPKATRDINLGFRCAAD